MAPLLLAKVGLISVASWLGVMGLIFGMGWRTPTDQIGHALGLTLLVTLPMLFFYWVAVRMLRNTRFGLPIVVVRLVDGCLVATLLTTLLLLVAGIYGAVVPAQFALLGAGTAIMCSGMLWQASHRRRQPPY